MDSRHIDNQRLVVVSNRLPALPESDGKPGASGKKEQPAAGGLVSALRPAMGRSGGLWFGWGGTSSRKPPLAPSLTTAGSVQLASLDLAEDDASLYYGTFSNRTMWPLLHSFIERMAVREDAYRAYRRVNQSFAQALYPLLKPNDLVWVHDYHLIPFGMELRDIGWTGKVGFFLHTPFPPAEIFAALPWAGTLLQTMLAYDLVGVHTLRHARHLLDALVTELDRQSITASRLGHGDQIRVHAHPVGTSPEMFAEMASKEITGASARSLQRYANGQHMFLGVDRLDYTKGIVERLYAFERLLERHPSWRGKVTLVQIAVPSRTRIREYVEERNRVERLVSQVNGQFSQPGWTPVQYFYRAFPQDALAKLYRDARVCLVTPLRDGMNLVAKEYVASQGENPGVLVLSRFCGAAEEMRDALLVNPYDISGMADAFHRALEMPLRERRSRQQKLLESVQLNTAEAWAGRFLGELSQVRGEFPEAAMT